VLKPLVVAPSAVQYLEAEAGESWQASLGYPASKSLSKKRKSLKLDTKAWFIKWSIDKLDFIKIKTPLWNILTMVGKGVFANQNPKND
jgi:hypothetical protein